MAAGVTADVSVSRDVAAPAETVWELVADLPRMGEWSPETEGGEWISGATGPVPGAKFKGSNRHEGKSWKTVARVVDADPGRRFSFMVKAAGLPVAEWAYDIEATESGCRVTESWTDRRPGFFKPLAARATGVPDRAEHNRATMEQTLERLAAAAEAASA
jgi:uncharacterized protein YndB with AHSA1/START domain